MPSPSTPPSGDAQDKLQPSVEVEARTDRRGSLDVARDGRPGGVLAGIARKAYPGSPMEVIEHAFLSTAMGVTGDARGIVRNGKNKRQVSLMELSDWRAALADIGANAPWQERRANLLVDGLDLPQRAGSILRIGDTARIETTMECDPCIRMEQVASGLMNALLPDWRGGVLGRVLSDGEIRVGDPIIIEGAE